MQAFDRKASHQASRPTILVAATAAVLALAGLVYLAAVAPRGIPGVDYYTLDAQFEDSADVRLLSSVLVAGRRVGQVSDITHRDGITHLELQLEPGTTPLRSDSTARVRLKNPVGAKYVAITPGRAGEPLEQGDAIPTSQTSASVDTPELLSGFDAPTRANLRSGVQGLGEGFLGRGQDINEALPESADLLEDATALSNAILDREGAAARFAPSAESLAEAYEPVREQLAQGFGPEAEALEVFADPRARLQDILEAAPPALASLREGLAQAQPFLNETTGFAAATTRLTGPAPAALRETTLLLEEGPPALQRTKPLLDSVQRAVSPTVSLLDRVDPVIDPSRRALASQIRPLVEIGGRQCDFFSWAKNWRNALSYGVPTGTDPLSELDHSQGLGPNMNSFRVQFVTPGPESLLADDPPADLAIGRNAYPEPCAAPAERYP